MRTGDDIVWWEVDVRTGAVQFNHGTESLLGYDPDRFEHYRDYPDLLHPDDHDDVVEAMGDRLAGETNHCDVDCRIRTSRRRVPPAHGSRRGERP